MTICNQWGLRLPKMQDQKLLTLCWCSIPGWGREPVSPVFDYKGGQYNPKRRWHTIINILWSIIGYLNATTNGKPQKATPAIGTDGSSQTCQNLLVCGYGSKFGQPRSTRLGFWTGLGPNQTVFALITRTAGKLPRPIANTSCIPNMQLFNVAYYISNGVLAGFLLSSCMFSFIITLFFSITYRYIIYNIL